MLLDLAQLDLQGAHSIVKGVPIHRLLWWLLSLCKLLDILLLLLQLLLKPS